MSDFDTRPQGTVMYGAFNAFAAAERALRVLKNAGYARAAFEHADEGEGAEQAEPTVVVVDAAKTGAARAAEILEEFGAHIYDAPPRTVAPMAPVAPIALVDELPEQTVFTVHAFGEATIVPEQTAFVAEPPASNEAPLAVPLHVTSQLERKPRVRKRRLVENLRPSAVPIAIEPPVREDIIIVTRGFEIANDA